MVTRISSMQKLAHSYVHDIATTNDDNPYCISFLGYARYREL